MTPARGQADSAIAHLFAWTGGALFAFSLGYFVYAYGWRMGRLPSSAPPEGPTAAITIDFLLFTVFAGHHSVMARTGAKRWLARHLPPSLERSVYVWISSVLLIATCAGWQDLPALVYRAGPPASWALRLVQLAGVALTLGGARVLDPLELAGIRQLVGGSPTSPFKVVGPYTWVRHPIYLGWMLMVFGAPVMTETRLLFAVISSLYLVVAIPWEERSLVESFGDQYREYQQRVRWRVLPFVY